MTECPACSGSLVSIALKLTDSELLMRSCSRCDRRFWQSDGDDIEITRVLGLDLLKLAVRTAVKEAEAKAAQPAKPTPPATDAQASKP